MKRVKSFLLLALAALSLFLSSQLWFGHPFFQTDRQIQAAYVSPGAAPLSDWRQLLAPADILIHIDGTHWALPEQLKQEAWNAVALVATAAEPAVLSPLDAEYVAALRDGKRGLGGMEIPLTVVGSFWWQAWHDWHSPDPVTLPASASGLKLQRAALFFLEPEVLLFIVQAEGRYWHHRLRLGDLPEGSGPVQATATLRELLDLRGPARGEQWKPVADPGEPRGGLTLQDGPLVPSTLAEVPVIVTVRPDPPDLQQLERALFGDVSAIGTVSGKDIIIRSDGQSSLAIHGTPVHMVEYRRAFQTTADSFKEQDGRLEELTALKEVLTYVNHAGGWPEGAYLSRLEPLRERGTFQLGSEPPVTGYRLEFSIRLEGLAVELPPVIVAEWVPDGITFYRRQFINLDPWRHLPMELRLEAEDSLSLVHLLPEEVLPVEAAHVLDVQLAYLSPPEQDPQEYFLFLTWQLTLQDGWVLWVDAAGVRPRVWLKNPTGDVHPYWLDGDDLSAAAAVDVAGGPP